MPSNQLNKLDTSNFTFLLDLKNVDKIVHACMFFGLSICYQLINKRPIVYTIAIPFLISFLIEILQEIMPFGRTFDWLDLLANFVGIIAAVGLYEIIKKAKK